MLDLNLDTFTGAGRRRDTSDATAVAKAKNLKEDSRTVTEDEGSGTSCSSVIIAGEETTSTGGGGGTGSCGFITFDILKRQGQETPQKEGNNPSPEYSTFPAAAGEEGFSSFASGEGQKWLKLSSPWCTSEVGKIGSSSNNNHRSIRKSRRGPRSRSSPYRGVTFYRRTGRWESHIWDCGKQVYLGGFDTAHSAARAYDRAAIKFRGIDADINFEASDYEEEMKLTRSLTKDEFVQLLRRQTNAGGGSKYRGGEAGGGGGGGLYKSCELFEAKTSQLIARNKICNIRDNNTSRDVTISDKVQNLDLSLGVSASAYRERKFPQRIESNGDLSSCSMSFAAKQNPVVFSGIYPRHRLISHQLGIVEKKVEEISPYNEISSNQSWRSIQGNNNNNFVFSGVCAASSRFSSSPNSSSSSTGPADSSSSLDLSLKPCSSSNRLGDIASLSSTTRNVGSYYISQAEDDKNAIPNK